MPSIFRDGQPISNSEAAALIARFDDPDNPKLFTVDKAVIDNFRENIADLEGVPGALPTGNDTGIRFYMGLDDHDNYGIVAVPMYGPTPSPGNARDRTDEKEKQFFTDADTSFFALVPSDNAISTDKDHCAELIALKDRKGKELVYFSTASFFKFIDGLKDEYVMMKINFARTDTDEFLTLVISCLDSNGSRVESEATYNGTLMQGEFFDSGEPSPPPSISDSFF